MPSGRCRPSVLGMYTLRDGLARYAPWCRRRCRSRRFSSRCSAYCSHVTPSTPGAASRFRARNAVRSRSMSTWWRSAVNLSSLSFFAASHTRSSALGALGPALRPGRGLLTRVPLGQVPSLRHLRCRSAGFVRRLRRYYGPVRLPWVVHRRCSAFALSGAARGHHRPQATQGSPGSRAVTFRTCFGS
jgi:hypothetical protein